MGSTPERPHVLYRFFDAEDVLLYVGRTVDPGSRWKNHSKAKPWWIDVVTVRAEHFPDLESVSAAERRAIETEHPRYNIVHRKPRTAALAETPKTTPDVVALGLRDGRCPVGLVVDWGEFSEFATLDLFGWLGGDFDAGRVSYPVHAIEEIRFARQHTDDEKRHLGFRREADREIPVWSMDPLGRFQAEWQYAHGLASAEDLARTNRLFTGV